MKKHFKILASILLMMVADLASAQTNANDVVKNIVKSFRDPKNVELTFNYRFFMGEESTSEEQKGMAYLQGEAYNSKPSPTEIPSGHISLTMKKSQ